jgi:hypothetical protein
MRPGAGRIDVNEPDDDQPSRRSAVIALVVVAVLIAAGWWLGDILAGVSRIQDCVMAGRRNCVVFR